MSAKVLKSCGEREAGQDRISNLPDNVIGHILSFLPMKDGKKTSLLSSKWRYKWSTVSCLVFNKESLPTKKATDYYGRKMDKDLKIHKLVRDIDYVLMLHSGVIRKFGLSYKTRLKANDIDKWILYISRHPVKEFMINMRCSPRYTMPPRFFSSQNFTQLDLVYCSLKPPSTFKGFKGLKRLTLADVSLQQDEFEILISSCALEKLCLAKLDGVDRLSIYVPNPQCFDIKARSSSYAVLSDCVFVINEPSLSLDFRKSRFYPNSEEICQLIVDAPEVQFDFKGPSGYLVLRNATCLAVFSMNDIGERKRPRNYGNLLKLITDMPQIERLACTCFSFESLDLGDIPRALPNPCLFLRYIFIRIDLTSFKGATGLLCLLRSVPNLQELEIFSSRDVINESSSIIWPDDQWDFPFAHLRHVRIKNFGGFDAEIDFVSFVLLSSPVLMKIMLKVKEVCAYELYGWKPNYRMMKRLLLSKRASPQAEIVFNDE